MGRPLLPGLALHTGPGNPDVREIDPFFIKSCKWEIGGCLYTSVRVVMATSTLLCCPHAGEPWGPREVPLSQARKGDVNRRVGDSTSVGGESWGTGHSSESRSLQGTVSNHQVAEGQVPGLGGLF